MGYLRRKARDSYKTSSELDKTLAEASQFYAELRRRVAEEDGLDPDKAAINPELAKLKERYGDELPGEISGLTAQEVLAQMAEDGEGESDEDLEDEEAPEPQGQTGRKPLTPRPRPASAGERPPRPRPKVRSKPGRKVAKPTQTAVSAPLRKRPAKGSPGRLVTLELPDGLLASIDEQIEAGDYTSIDDFVKEAVRDKLRSLRR